MTPLGGIRRARESLRSLRHPQSAVAERVTTPFPWQLTRRLASSGRLLLIRVAAANDSGPGCYVLKMPRRKQPDDDVACARLRRESAVTAEVSHSNLISVLSAEWGASQPYVVLPYLEGITLRRLIGSPSPVAETSRPPLPIGFALSIVRQIATALGAMHASGWLHGQVWPEHVMISPQGHTTLIDLTQARRLTSSECDTAEIFPAAAHYAAPETTSPRDRLTPAADTYSLGVMLFEALAGQPPFSAAAPRQLMACHRRAAPPDLRQLRAGISLEVAALVRRVLAKEPLRRPSDDELVRWLAELEIEELSS